MERAELEISLKDKSHLNRWGEMAFQITGRVSGGGCSIYIQALKKADLSSMLKHLNLAWVMVIGLGC